MSERRRIAITGIGVVSPLGIGRKALWDSVLEGRNGHGPITLFDASEMEIRIACEAHGFEPADFMPAKMARRMDRFQQLGLAAARLAVEDADLEGVDLERTGVVLGNGACGVISLEQGFRTLRERGPERVSPFAAPMLLPNIGAGYVAMELGLHGPNFCIGTACAAGGDALGSAAAIIRRGDADMMLAGGADSTITPFFTAGFEAMGVLSRSNDDPARATRPFSVDRQGFAMGEAGVVMVLEELRSAQQRGARVICELAGYGQSIDGHNIADPDPTGEPQARAVRIALADAQLVPEQIGYINGHGGGSRVGDAREVAMLQAALGEQVAEQVSFSSTKGGHGHCMGATGALEAAITALALAEQVLPPTLNLEQIDPDCEGIGHVTGAARPSSFDVALSANYGLGGHNAVLALRLSR